MSSPDTSSEPPDAGSEPPGAGPHEPADLVDRRVADRYQLVRLVSVGANTSIYDATDLETGRAVTLKLIQPAIAQSPSFRERFEHEMGSVSSLSHPNIAALYDWGMTPVGDVSTAFVVTESLTGGSLRDVFDRGRRLSPSQALMVGLEACRGLDHAHRRGFVHTELSPAKLVFGDDRRLRIIDFGLARLLGAPAWEHPDSVPNHVAWYAAPEQGSGVHVDGRADVYALGLSLHEAVTGELPFKTDSTVATLAARVGRLMPVSADLGPLASVLERAGRPDAADRATAAQFGQALVQTAAKLPRPEPLPLLSSRLFDTPAAQMRTPDDPTGGVTRPGATTPVFVVPATPDELAPAGPTPDEAPEDVTFPADSPTAVVAVDELDPGHDPGDVASGGAASNALVILPLDSDLDGRSSVDVAPAADEFRPAELPATRAMPATAPPSAMPHRSRRWLGRTVLGVLLVAALAVLAVLASRLFETPEYAVPDLVGVPEAEARNIVAANGWDIVVEHEQSDLVPEVGDVVRTAPAAGVSLAEGEPFLMVVSEGPVPRELPDSNGFALADAENRLRERGLTSSVIEAYDEVIPFGTVVSWSVPGDSTLRAGSLVPPGTEVELVVSQGPEPRVVPDLVDVAGSDARLEAERRDLVYVETGTEFDDEIIAGRVISQTPAPGDEVQRGTTVSVVVSRGPDVVEFPDLRRAASYEEAAAILREAGFDPRLTFGDTQGELREITIDGDDAVVGQSYPRGSRVDIEALTL